MARKKSQKQLKVKRLLCMWSLQSKKATVAYFLSKPLMGWMIHAAAAYLSVFKGILESYMSFLFYFQSSELKNIRYCRIIGYFRSLVVYLGHTVCSSIIRPFLSKANKWSSPGRQFSLVQHNGLLAAASAASTAASLSKYKPENSIQYFVVG